MSGLPMIACSERRPMLPVVHWITRNGRSGLVLLIGCSFAVAIGLICSNPAHVHASRASRAFAFEKRSKPSHADREEHTAEPRPAGLQLQGGHAIESRPAQASNRANWSCRYCSTQAARRILPLVVVGIDPGDTRTRSPTFRPCALDIAEVTSLLTSLSQCIASSLRSFAS